MRHNKKFNHLGRKSAHRDALLSNLACSLIKHKRINTTTAKAKALRKYIEPLITKSKAANDAVITPVLKTVKIKKEDGTVAKIKRKISVNSSTPARRIVFKYLRDKEAVMTLFGDIAQKVADRPGGYTRIIRTGFRLGDAAEMCFIELVDYNENMLKQQSKKTTKTRRSKKKEAVAEPTTSNAEVAATSAEVTENPVAE
jgi:large subunit ribosomal protein L17